MRWFLYFICAVKWSDDFVSCNAGECPFFPNALPRDKSCFEQSNCKLDSECKSNEKCCENPCGITQCFDVDMNSNMNLEKCPVQNPSSSKCQEVRTKFCYSKSCLRCCYHSKSCNPAPSLLTDPSLCYKELCTNYKCLQQGSQCIFDETTKKPQCKCIEECNNSRNYVCGNDSLKLTTYINTCHLNREACQREVTIVIESQGRCKIQQTLEIPIRGPIIKSKVIRADLGESVLVYCYGDQKVVHLSWTQVRQGGQIPMTDSFVLHLGTYMIEGKERKVSVLKLAEMASSMYAKYACVQTFNNSQLSDYVVILPKQQEAFDRRICGLVDPNPGLNEKIFPNFFYDAASGVCKSFFYAGFGGNGNNFQSLDECQTKCEGKGNSTFLTELIHEGENCGEEVCNFYSKCEQISNNKKCMCPNQCSLKKNLVCGSDGKTYMNICIMQFHACRWREPLVALYAGKCDKAISEGTKAIPQTQGKSLCELKNCPPLTKCFINTLTNAPQCYCENVCTFKVDIVCASDNKEYLNECFMEAHSCKVRKVIFIKNPGLCKKSLEN